MQHTPQRRIERVLERHGVVIRRSPRWIEEAHTGHLAQLESARAVLQVK